MLERLVSTGKLTAELDRGLKTYVRYRAWLASDIVQWPFWTVFLFLSITMYAPQLMETKAVINMLTWSFFVFIFVSSFMWVANSVVMEAQQGIIENIILSNTSLHVHILGRIVITIIDFVIGGAVFLLLASFMFGADIAVANPLLFTASIVTSFIFFLAFSAVFGALLIAVRSPWIVISIVQFVIPFASGGIPVQLLPAEAARIVMFSPFFYVIHPIIASATNTFYLPLEVVFTAAVSSSAIMFLLSIYVEKRLVRKALKTGRLTLF